MPLITNISKTKQVYGITQFPPDCKVFYPQELVDSTCLLETGDFRVDPNRIEPKQGTNIVMFSGCPYHTTGGGQQPPQIANALIKLGYNINFIQSVSEKNPIEGINIIGEPQLFAPSEAVKNGFYSKELVTELYNEDSKNLLILTFTTDYMSDAVDTAIELGYTVIYWCLDDWEEINKAQNCTFHRLANEIDICQKAHHVITTASTLQQKIFTLSGRQAEVIENGVDLSQFETAYQINKPQDLLIGSHGTLVYWGELQGRWIDIDLIESIAISNPNVAINLIGPYAHAPRIIQQPNVKYLGTKKVTELLAYGQYSDAGIIPFIKNTLTDAVNPIKAYEYLACNLPIFTPRLDEMVKFPFTVFYDDAEDLSSYLKKPKNKWGEEANPDIEPFLEKSTWQQRAISLLKGIGYVS